MTCENPELLQVKPDRFYMIRDGFLFLRYNLQHYSLALWGLRLRFDPPYPILANFFPSLIAEPVFEYRSYGALVLFAGLMAWALPPTIVGAFLLLWFGVSFDRCKYLQSNLVFWRRTLKENGRGFHRAQGRYIEALIREMERRMKTGEDWQECAQEATELQDEVIALHGRTERARVILAGK